MRYLQVTWRHDSSEDPVELYSELDDESREVRKVEVFRDGRLGYADASESAESTRLGLVPVPPLEQIASDPEFEPEPIDRGRFEQLWNSARLVLRPE